MLNMFSTQKALEAVLVGLMADTSVLMAAENNDS